MESVILRIDVDISDRAIDRMINYRYPNSTTTNYLHLSHYFDPIFIRTLDFLIWSKLFPTFRFLSHIILKGRNVIFLVLKTFVLYI